MNLALRVGIALSVVTVAVALSMRAQAADPIIRCGTLSGFVAPSAAAAGSVVVTTGGDALKVMIPAGTAASGLSGYACVQLTPGTPSAIFAGLVAAGQPGYVTEALPATATSPLAKFGQAMTSLVVLTTALVFFSILVVLGSYGGRWGRRPVAAAPYNSAIRQRPGGVRASHR